jgi:hypothetical protein
MAPRTTQTAILTESIAMRAHELYQHRGYEHGHDLDDWLIAESEIMDKATPKPRAVRTVAPRARKAKPAA